MPFAQGHEMFTGESLTRQSLTSVNDAFTLVHQDDGNLVLYRNADRVALWATATYGTAAGRAVLQEDGNLVVYDADGAARWDSGTHGSQVIRLTVQDDGDVVLADDAGQVQWHSNTATDDPPAGPPVARGDRMRRGESLTRQSLTSPNGRYVLVHQDDGNTVLYRDGGPAIWAENEFIARSSLVLADDGSLTVRYPDGRSRTRVGLPSRELVVRDDGNVVLVDDNGRLTWATGTSDAPVPTSIGDRLASGEDLQPGQCLTSPNEQFRLISGIGGELVLLQPGAWEPAVRWRGAVPGRHDPGLVLVLGDNGDLALREAAGEVRWRSDTAKNWLAHLGIEEAHCVTFVRGVDEREALTRLGAPAVAIRPMTFAEANEITFSGHPLEVGACAVAIRFGEWVLLIEQNGSEGVDLDRARALSVDGEMVSSCLTVNYDQRFVYARDGVVLVEYDEGAPEYATGADPAVIDPYIEQVGRHLFTDDYEPEDGVEPERPDLALACAISGVYPRPEDFDGQLVGATWETSSFARMREAMAVYRSSAES